MVVGDRLELLGGEKAQAAVPAAAVVEAPDVVDSERSSAFSGHERRWMCSFVMVAKKLSATALS
jgi:hypothetical protein